MRSIAVLLAILLLSCGESAEGDQSGGENAPSGKSENGLTVETVKAVVSLSRERILTTGTVLADEETDLMSEVSGRIASLNFREGQPVKRGELLVQLVNDDLKAEYRKAEYEMKLQEEKEERQRKLLDIEAVSEEVYDAELSRLNVLKAQLSLLEAQIAKTEIRAPFDGTVGLRYVSPGGMVSTDTKIASMQKVKPVKIEFTVPERYSRRVKAGGTIRFTAAGIRDTLSANIYAREPRIDAAARALRFRARYANADEILLPGGFVNVDLLLSDDTEVIEIPGKAVVPQIKGAKVFVVEGGKVAERDVDISGRDAEFVRISSGLNPGDEVVVSGLMQIRAGMPVKTKPQELRNSETAKEIAP